MNIEILAIGEEVLKGFTVNTNAAFLSKELRRRGYKVTRHLVIPDVPEIIEESITDAFRRSNIVITTGGLGPTSDDLTSAILAKIFPNHASHLHNSLGTAKGFAFSEQGKTIIALPGIPREMEAMFLSEAVPFLAKHNPIKEKQYVEDLYFGILSENPVDSYLSSLKLERGIEVGLYPSLGVLHVAFSGKERLKLIAAKEKVKEKFKDHFFDSETGSLEEAVHKIFIGKNKTLALAESCTGGAIAKRLTTLAGASDYFLGSIVCYSNEVKEKFLQVTLDENGAVSLEATTQMAKGVLESTSCDYALAVTGIAGPAGGSDEKPVGTVYLAIAERGKQVVAGRFQAKGKNRSWIIEYTTNFCLFSLLKYLESHTPPMFA